MAQLQTTSLSKCNMRNQFPPFSGPAAVANQMPESRPRRNPTSSHAMGGDENQHDRNGLSIDDFDPPRTSLGGFSGTLFWRASSGSVPCNSLPGLWAHGP